MLDFNPLKDYLSYQSQEFLTWFAKHWSNFCGIGAKMKLFGLWKDDLCPCCCLVPEKSTTHLFLCPEPSITQRRNKLFNEILQWMDEVDTCPHILHMISKFWYGEQVQLEEAPFIFRKIYNTLQEIGVQYMWMGILPLHLIKQQQLHYQLIGSRRTGQNGVRH